MTATFVAPMNIIPGVMYIYVSYEPLIWGGRGVGVDGSFLGEPKVASTQMSTFLVGSTEHKFNGGVGWQLA